MSCAATSTKTYKMNQCIVKETGYHCDDGYFFNIALMIDTETGQERYHNGIISVQDDKTQLSIYFMCLDGIVEYENMQAIDYVFAHCAEIREAITMSIYGDIGQLIPLFAGV